VGALNKLKSTQILDDGQRSLDLLENVPYGDKQLVRIFWTFWLVSLRRVVNALEKFDIAAFLGLREPYERRKDEMFALKGTYRKDTPFKECPSDYLIYHQLIHGERNIAVHEAERFFFDPWMFLGANGHRRSIA